MERNPRSFLSALDGIKSDRISRPTGSLRPASADGDIESAARYESSPADLDRADEALSSQASQERGKGW